MNIFYNIFAYLITITLIINIVNASLFRPTTTTKAATPTPTPVLEYTENGVLRKSSSGCNINFVNFGIESSITSINEKISYNNNNVQTSNIPKSTFNLILENLVNGNIRINNNGESVTNEELKSLIKVTQGDNNLDFTVSIVSSSPKYFSLTINNLETCDNLTIKQTHKYNVNISTFLLYANIIPDPVDKAYSNERYGPSGNGSPYSVIQWNMEGLDALRQQCGIYIKYATINDKYRWNWYLSRENKNIKNCSNPEFYKIVKQYFVDYNPMYEMFGDYYEGYLLQSVNYYGAHMDGILIHKYIIEIYQENCGGLLSNGSQVACTISSDNILSYGDFTNKVVKECLPLFINSNETPKWTLNTSSLTGTFNDYSIKIENLKTISNEGSIPKSTSGNVSYKVFDGADGSGIARFKATLSCNKDSVYMDNKCRCHRMIII